MRFRTPLFIVAVLLVSATISQAKPAPKKTTHNQIAGKPALKTTADKLKATIVTPYIEQKMVPGKNILWCNTFQLAWNELYDLSGGPVKLKPPSAMADILNKRQASKADIDEAGYVAMAGVDGAKLVKRIRRELATKFHGQESPDSLNQVPANLVVAYAYLFKQLPFDTAFTRFPQGVDFQGRSVEGFGIHQFHKRDAAQAARAKQVVVLAYRGTTPTGGRSLPEFIVELKTRSNQDRLILAQIPAKATMKETIREVKARIAASEPEAMEEMADLRVPVLNFDILRTYREVMGRNIISKNKDLDGRSIDRALQSVRFKLDETGAVVKSEAVIALKSASMKNLIFNRPFLIVLQRRGAKNPYFALWVDNPELLVEKR